MSTKEKTIELSEWMKRATRDQRRIMYEAADTSKSAVSQVVTGHRGLSAAKAAQIEQATLGINEAFPDLPPVLRTSSCATCAACPYAKKCLDGDK